jgi:hypothetical protein
MGLIWWVLAIFGAVRDSRYIKAGGKKPGALELILWGLLPVLFLGYFLFLTLSVNPNRVVWDQVAHGFGEMLVTTFPAYLTLYEVGRWFVRWKNPVKVDRPVSV